MANEAIINNSNVEKNINPLRILAAISIVAGAWAMLFEIYFFKAFQIELYLARVSFTLLATVIFFLSFKKFTRPVIIILIHVLILGLISSFIFTIIMIPTTIYINSQILSLLIFTFALIFSWEVTQQIIVAIYYNLLFAASIFYSDPNIFQLPNILSLVIFVSFISLLSVAVSWVIYKNRRRYLEKTNEIKFLFNSAPVGIVRINSDGKILAANKYFLDLFDIDDDSKSYNLFEMLAPLEKEKELLKQKITGQQYDHIEETMADKDGRHLYLQIVAQRIDFTDSKEATIECIITDKTKEKFAEREKNKALEVLFEEARQKEQHARLAIEEKNQKIKLLAKINHEVRTPLNAILVYFDMIESGDINSIEEFQDFAKTVKISAESLLQTINNFIDFAKIEAGKIEYEEEEFDIKETLNSTIKLLGYLAQTKENKIVLKIDKLHDTIIKTDKIKFRQVLINLIGNAIKFTDHGEISVEVKSVSEEDGKKLVTKVTDTGKGIPQDLLDKIFEPFNSIEQSKIDEYSSGLGLAICKEFISMLNGEIHAESEYRIGTTVTFSIPYKV
ncbi:MAG: PAS domain-containing sensor histidine kinase [Melioribacteraceae bacterium]|nr:PAS domain-containing sensor histidine kinase [Melioribacteraceae bacterium]